MKPLPIDSNAYFASKKLDIELIRLVILRQWTFQLGNLRGAISDSEFCRRFSLTTAARKTLVPIRLVLLERKSSAEHVGFCFNLVCAAVSKL